MMLSNIHICTTVQKFERVQPFINLQSNTAGEGVRLVCTETFRAVRCAVLSCIIRSSDDTRGQEVINSKIKKMTENRKRDSS